MPEPDKQCSGYLGSCSGVLVLRLYACMQRLAASGFVCAGLAVVFGLVGIRLIVPGLCRVGRIGVVRVCIVWWARGCGCGSGCACWCRSRMLCSVCPCACYRAQQGAVGDGRGLDEVVGGCWCVYLADLLLIGSSLCIPTPYLLLWLCVVTCRCVVVHCHALSSCVVVVVVCRGHGRGRVLWPWSCTVVVSCHWALSSSLCVLRLLCVVVVACSMRRVVG